MPQTPIPGGSYCSPARLLDYFDWQQVADLLRDADRGPRPLRSSIVDTTQEAGGLCLRTLETASGMLNAAAQVGRKYTPDDLAALQGAGKAYLDRLTAALCFWLLSQRKMPLGANPNQVPQAQAALDELERLRAGERIFSLYETAEAGFAHVIEPQPAARPAAIVRNAVRLFGSHSEG